MTGPDLIRAARDMAAVCEDMDPDEFAVYLDKWATSAGDKAGAYVAVARRLDDEAQIAKADEADARARRQRAEANRDAVLGLLRGLVESASALGQTIPGVRLQRTAPSLVCPESAALWPRRWVEVVEVERVDRAAAKAALLAGETVEGFALVEGTALHGWKRRGGAS